MKNIIFVLMIAFNVFSYAKPADHLKAESVTDMDLVVHIFNNWDYGNLERLLKNGLNPNLLDGNRFLESPMSLSIGVGDTASRESQEGVIKFLELFEKYGGDFHVPSDTLDRTLLYRAIMESQTLVFRYLMGKGLSYYNPFDYKLQHDKSQTRGLMHMFHSCNLKIIKIIYTEYGETRPICEFAEYTQTFCHKAIKALAPKINQDPKDCFE